MCDLLWAELDVYFEDDWCETRGSSYTYGRGAVEKFLAKHNFTKIIRSSLVEVISF